MSFESLLNTTCTIQRSVKKRTEVGGTRRVWSDVSTMTDIPCRIEQLRAMEMLVQGRDGVKATHRCFLRAGHTIYETDRLVHDGIYYDIYSAPSPFENATSDHHIELILTRVT